MDKKYQVFISSTYRDLIPERQAITRSILDLGHIPSGMELFPAADEEQFSYIKKVIDECDYYVLVIAGRYGSLDEHGVGYTEKEYNYAVETGKTVLAFVRKDRERLPRDQTESDPIRAASLEQFISRASTGRLVSFWSNPEELDLRVTKSLAKAFQEKPGVGWVRATGIANEDLLQKLNEVRNSNETLTQERDRLGRKLLALEAASKPHLTGLAELTEEVPLTYSFRERGAHGIITVSTHLKATWASIFGYVGPQMTKPTSSLLFQKMLEGFVQERTALSGISVPLSIANIVRIQMEAQKLIRVYTGVAVKGGVHEFIELTPVGRSKLMELLTVRQPPVSAGD